MNCQQPDGPTTSPSGVGVPKKVGNAEYRQAYEDTDIVFNHLEGLVLALQDLTFDHPSLGTSERIKTPINAIIDMLPSVLKHLGDGRQRERETIVRPKGTVQ